MYGGGYYDEPGILRGHSGNGGMTSSLAMGTCGSADERRLARFPLSPTLHTGRSGLSAGGQLPLFDPRTTNVVTTSEQLVTLITEQWTSRSKPKHTREEIDLMLAGKMLPRSSQTQA